MTPLTKTIIAVLHIGLFVTSMVCEAKTNTNTKGKYYLVYLVSVPKLEVGKKVYVEPVFFSNGKEIIPLYEYCRAVNGGWVQGRKEVQKKVYDQWDRYKKTLTQYGSTDVNKIKPFCHNKSYKIPAQNYTIINNMDQRIRIGTVQFNANRIKLKLHIPPLLPSPGTATIAEVGEIRFDLQSRQELKYTGPYYFLMTANKATLRDILPVKVPSKKIVAVLLKKARVLAKQNHGMTTKKCPKGECNIRWYQEKKRLSIVSYKGKGVFFNTPLFADFDNDGVLDLSIHIQSSKPTKLNGYMHYWDALGIIFSSYKITKGQILTKAQLQMPKSQAGYFTYNHPLMYIQISGCKYLIITGGYDGTDLLGIVFLTFPAENRKCKDIYAHKVIPVF